MHTFRELYDYIQNVEDIDKHKISKNVYLQIYDNRNQVNIHVMENGIDNMTPNCNVVFDMDDESCNVYRVESNGFCDYEKPVEFHIDDIISFARLRIPHSHMLTQTFTKYNAKSV